MQRLRNKMIDALEERNFPPKTVDAYVAAVADLSRHYQVSPDLLSSEQVRVWLELQRPKVADLVFQILVRGLAFFFVEVLRWPIVPKTCSAEISRRARSLRRAAAAATASSTLARAAPPGAASRRPSVPRTMSAVLSFAASQRSVETKPE